MPARTPTATQTHITESALGLTPIPPDDTSQPHQSPRTFRVILLREGLAKTGRFFTRQAVQDCARLAEGARAFADHPTPTEDRERPTRSVRDVVGFYRDAHTRIDEVTGLLQAEATLHVFESASWLAKMARELLSASPSQEVIGLSVDTVALINPGTPPGTNRPVPVVEGIAELKSVDVVTRPSAGGAFVQVMESENPTHPMQDTTTTPTNESDTANANAAPEVLREAERVTANVLAKIDERDLALDCKHTLADRLARCDLPAPVLKRIRAHWTYAPGRWTTADDYADQLDAAIALEAETLGELRTLLTTNASDAASAAGATANTTGSTPAPGDGAPTSGLVTGYGDARVMVAESDKQRLVAQVAMDRLFGLDGHVPATTPTAAATASPASLPEDPDWRRARQLGLVTGAPRWQGIREAYVALTGDSAICGQVFPEASIVREANEVTTGVLNQALLNSMTKRLVMDYRGQEQTWRKFCQVVPLQNFKSQDRVRLHDFSSLSTVAEGAAYTNLAWDDSREAYAPSKRGNLVVVTREAIYNDDVRAIRRIPQKLARAAYITINEFVYGLFTSNPLMADGSKVFDDGVQTSHGNRGTTALSSSALQAAITTMMKQTDTANKRLNLKPRYLLVPADLYFTALTIVNSTLVPGSANNDANVLKGAVEPISVAQFTDATDYYLICDPLDIESIEIGFVGGREDPELLKQDTPLLGQVFTNDQLSYKVRWEFGGGWLDYRGAFVANVAG